MVEVKIGNRVVASYLNGEQGRSLPMMDLFSMGAIPMNRHKLDIQWNVTKMRQAKKSELEVAQKSENCQSEEDGIVM